MSAGWHGWGEGVGKPAPGNTRLTFAGDRDKLPALRWLVKRLLPRTGLGQLYGPSYTGKTYLALALALAVCNGLPEWFGHRVKRTGPVLYAAMEGRSDLQQRIRAWLDAHPGCTDEGLVTLLEEELDLARQDSVDRLVAELAAEDVRPVLVVIDTQRLATLGAKENENDERTRPRRARA